MGAYLGVGRQKIQVCYQGSAYPWPTPVQATSGLKFGFGDIEQVKIAHRRPKVG